MAATTTGGLLDAELALDRAIARVDAELPAHVRAYARAYARAATPPPAPDALHATATLEAALVACRYPALAPRGLDLLRLVAPLVVEADPRVAAARRAIQRTAAGYVALAEARDAAARARFGHAHRTLLHDLHGVTAIPEVADAPPVDAWTTRDDVRSGVVRHDRFTIADAWNAIAAHHGLAGAGRVDLLSTPSRSRAFVVAPGREVIVAIPPRVDSPATRFATLHELGHALGAIASPRALPRVVDEAVAAYVARAMEPGGLLPDWTSALAPAARRRRHALAAALDTAERTRTPPATIPWALWHDPHAQAAYVVAEQLADELAAARPTDLPATLAAIVRRIDAATPA